MNKRTVRQPEAKTTSAKKTSFPTEKTNDRESPKKNVEKKTFKGKDIDLMNYTDL